MSKKEPNPMDAFEMDVSAVKDKLQHVEAKVDDFNLCLSGSEADVSHTIEELLELNKLIPAQTDEEIKQVGEGQLDETDNRGEESEITEAQFDDRKTREESRVGIIEYRLNDGTDSEYDQRNEDAWKSKEMRGHNDVPKIWEEVYNIEDAREKLNKGQLDRKASLNTEKIVESVGEDNLGGPQSISGEALKRAIGEKE